MLSRFGRYVASSYKMRAPKSRGLIRSWPRTEGLRGTFFRQAMFAEFELAVHDPMEAGEGMSGEKLTAIYLDLLKRYHGPKVAIDPVYAADGPISRISTAASTSTNMRRAPPPRPISRRAY